MNSHHFEALFKYSTIGILITDEQGRIIAINPFALREFRYRQEELLGKKFDMLCPSRFRVQYTALRDSYFKNPTTTPLGQDKDLFALRKDNSEFPVEVSLGSYLSHGTRYVIAFVSNISVRMQAISDIKNLNDELETTVEQRTEELTNAMHLLEQSKEEVSKALVIEKELSELKSRFVTMASHEFRTPLSTILSSAYLIRKYIVTEDQSKREKHLERIVSSVFMLTEILNDFLSMGKIEEGKIQTRLSKFNLKECIGSIIREVEDNLKLNQKIIYQHFGTSDVILDASLFKHIIMNLISNASKFSPEDSILEITTILRKYILILSVKDKGMGISPEDQKHLMERFFRGSNVANIRGTGLGLHIIAKYAELMNGIVECKSELGKGTVFTITFNTNDKHNEENFTH
ncbi:MAG: PAS domain-containing sensor histidine kinase [Saprospiraceae bacterium]